MMTSWATDRVAVPLNDPVRRQANLMAWHHSHRAHGLALERLAAVRDRPGDRAFWQAVEEQLRPIG